MSRVAGAPRVYRAILTVHDFFHYVSREMKTGAVEPYISSTALMYALNLHHRRQAARLVSGYAPHYREDLPSFTVYATPAVEEPAAPAAVGGRTLEGFGGDIVKITYNSVDETLAVSMEVPKRINVPKQGAYYKYTPLTTFRFYTVGGRGPSLIRIGKKLVPARVAYTELRCERRRGVFRPSHPVPLIDIDAGGYRVLGGVWAYVHPYPLLVDAVLEGDYYMCGREAVIVPPRDLYASVQA